MKSLYIKSIATYLLLSVAACQDIVTYNDGYDDGTISTGAPSVSGVYKYNDTDAQNPITKASFLDMIMLKGSNLSNVKKITVNNVEVPLSEVYARADAAYFPIPRVIPAEVTNKLYYETALGSTTVDFTVTVPQLKIERLYNEFALPGSSVQVVGEFFDLYGFGTGSDATASVSMNGTAMKIDSLTEKYMSVVIPENAPDNTLITFTYMNGNTKVTQKVPYRFTKSVVWDLSQPSAYGFWAGTEHITNGSGTNDPEPLYGPYIRIAGSFKSWSWNNLPCGGFNLDADIAANPADYLFKFEVCSASGNPFYDSGKAGYLIQLNGGQYAWNPSQTNSFNTYGKWCTVSLELTEVATKGLKSGWIGMFWILQPNSDWNVDHSFANIRIEKKITNQ
ncbi:glycan-binding surface protein [Tannerella sp.]|uniref:glycan-binding surface protein n=1 Tax=Tannerella sp. TaxID=2382127 RepID=UPI0026DC07E8|nr:glycan-binding surface protein [Tannerella sp.]MDO4703082.1 glycan-binding surface protein [Tannerella sp.]